MAKDRMRRKEQDDVEKQEESCRNRKWVKRKKKLISC